MDRVSLFCYFSLEALHSSHSIRNDAGRQAAYFHGNEFFLLKALFTGNKKAAKKNRKVQQQLTLSLLHCPCFFSILTRRNDDNGQGTSTLQGNKRKRKEYQRKSEIIVVATTAIINHVILLLAVSSLSFVPLSPRISCSLLFPAAQKKRMMSLTCAVMLNHASELLEKKGKENAKKVPAFAAHVLLLQPVLALCC
jgi:hypothetical protein